MVFPEFPSFAGKTEEPTKRTQQRGTLLKNFTFSSLASMVCMALATAEVQSFNSLAISAIGRGTLGTLFKHVTLVFSLRFHILLVF